VILESMQMRSPSEPRILAEGKYLRLVVGNGWEWVDRVNTSGAVVIVAVTEDARLVLVEQYRVPLAARVIELPAGLTGDTPDVAHEAAIQAARRELLEETGYEADRWEYLIDGPSSAGLATEAYSLFLARDARKVGPGGGDAAEDIEVHAIPLAEVESWILAKRHSGILADPKIFAGLYFAQRRN
jgi:ADP-ribose pyrophosphatase